MDIIITNNSMIPIYEQIVNQIEQAILNGNLKFEQPLPSVRLLASELKISTLTVKKAYDKLEADGFIKTVHGKGSYVNILNSQLIFESNIKQIEQSLFELVEKANNKGIDKRMLHELFNIVIKEIYD